MLINFLLLPHVDICRKIEHTIHTHFLNQNKHNLLVFHSDLLVGQCDLHRQSHLQRTMRQGLWLDLPRLEIRRLLPFRQLLWK
jgi:hypothetical protein